MSMFASGVTEQIDLGDGDWIEIRKLSWSQLQESERAAQRNAAEIVKSFGGDVLGRVREAREDGEVEAAATDPMSSHDMGVLLRAGIIAWSDTRKLTTANILDLDQPIAELVARRILALSLADQDEGARKNG